MKRFLAAVLAGCLIVQPLPGAVLVAGASDFGTFLAEDETAAVAADSAGAENTGQESVIPEITQSETAETPAVGEPDASGSETDALPQEDAAGQLPAVGDEQAQEQQSGEEKEQASEQASEGSQADETELAVLPEDELISDDTFSLEEIEIVDEMIDAEPESGSGLELESESELTFEFETEEYAGLEPMFSAGEWEGSFIEVKVISTTAHDPGEVRVTLTGSSHETNEHNESHTLSRTLNLPGKDGEVSDTAKILVEPGEYTVTVSADRFADFVQEKVQVGAHQTARLEVCTDKEEKRGWLRLGDVNADRAVTEADIDAILAAIHSGSSAQVYNLNDRIDQVVDIADLQLAVQSLYAAQEDLLATVETLSVPKQVLRDEQTAIEGAENLLNDNGKTMLKTANEEEISEENPVSMTFAFDEVDENGESQTPAEQLPKLGGITLKAPLAEDGTSDIASGEAIVSYLDAAGNPAEMAIALGESQPQPQAVMLMDAEAPAVAAAAVGGQAKLEPDGSLVLDFNGQVAVKRVTIRITGTKKDKKLAEIAKVEFVNDMESRIPAPQLNIPTPVVSDTDNEEFTVSWDSQSNVTGYELEITGPVKKAEGLQTQIVRVSASPHTVSSINDLSLINFETYSVRVRSVNGEWNSPWSGAVTAEPAPKSTPAAVDNVSAKGGYRSIRVTWKDMDDANGYMVYYRMKGAADFAPVVEGYAQPLDGSGRLTKNDYTITGLLDGTEYEVCVAGWNRLGWGPYSIVSVAETDSGDVPQLPRYRLINTSNGVGALTAHIVQAVCGTNLGQKMVESPLDEAKGDTRPTVSGSERPYARWAFGVVDDSYASYWLKTNEWDDGVAYPVNDFSKGLTVTFDQEYAMNYLTFTAADIQGNPETARVMYWNSATGDAGAVVGCTLLRQLDATNRPYYVVKFHEKVNAGQIQLCIGTGYSRIEMKIAEMHFHAYDSVDDDIAALFGDEMHTTLAAGVTAETIDALQARIDTPDENGEYHPLRPFLQLDLDAARELLTLQADETIYVDNRITARKDGHINFGGLNEWQPLGRVAAAGDKLVVYVGHNTKSFGESSNLKLIFTQYHAQSDRLAGSYSLKVGRNEITLKPNSTDNFERGGQLYIAYDGNSAADKYGVRISGGVKIPVLNIYGLSGAEKTAAIEAYVAGLGDYVQTIASEHERLHANGENKNVQYEYGDGRNCILDATDLMMEHMMYSVPASQIWAALSGASDKAAQLESALDAIEKTMTLFYQHKGLMKGAGGSSETPSRHLNIRYMRMFAGAFMYASGNHIGVEWPETRIAASATTWNGFGWGIAHEIGHDINDPKYAIAEITNNYFAQLLTKAYSGTRFRYEDVYRKVTSGAIGRSPNGAVQLALYWQLHLAFDDFTDNGDDRYLFDSYDEMCDNLFFARVDTYSRNPGLAKKGEKELKLDGGVDQNLMRLACAAADADILSFFERWGMVPDEETVAYASACGEATSKALYYVNDDARDYRAAHAGEDTNSFDPKITATVAGESNRVTVNMSTDAPADLVLGYEIIRSTITDGFVHSEVIGFQQAKSDGTAEYVDVIAALDNRVLGYEVRAVDKFLNYSKAVKAGEKKISTGGALGKDSWTVETTMTSADDVEIAYDHDDPDSGYGADSGQAKTERSIYRILDDAAADVEGDGEQEGAKHVYHGTSLGNERIVIDMQKEREVTSVRYMGSELASVSLSVSADGSTWIPVKEDYRGLVGSGCAEQFVTIWFDSVQATEKDKWIGTYDARYLRLILPESGEITINEIDVCGPSGDNIEFYSADGEIPAVGIAANDYEYGKDKDGKALTIPAGSLLFAGTYKGNPAYNVVMLYDQDGNVIGADKDTNTVHAEQVIFADVPERGDLGETSAGTWVYYVEKGYWNEETIAGITGVRAELLRVDNALTLEGERVVSDTLSVAMPSYGELRQVTLTSTIKPSDMQ